MFSKKNKNKKTIPVQSEKKEESISKFEDTKNWIEEEEEEGELLVDVFQQNDNILIRSTVAGVKPEDIDIDINNDMITIRGKRKECSGIDEDDYFYRECYWGSFSRSVILPCEVQASKVKANLKDGVLTVTLPKVKKEKSVKVSIDVK
ncbi:MAG: Hsp20/alpha crystallin family protein [Patescibacteria group bacterium]|nr:Hsp20/alpha crystallin family protein [Patescibacteria group bacterium]MDD4304170.1 Hsp20/alpha crystallin family protein [Patescibacteria group bacterium]MDD4695202.1 Hsp20/alpha crystallin family protein [Patescibacteria group bacterium]